MIFIVGMITLAAGLAMVLAHNIWSGGALAVVVTLVGWITLIKNLFFLFLPPEVEAGVFLRQLHYQELFYLYGVVSLFLGIYLTPHRDGGRSPIYVAVDTRGRPARGAEVGIVGAVSVCWGGTHVAG
jgi:hypothetical protein